MATAYETVYIVDTSAPEDQVKSIIEKYSGIITKNGGTVDDIDIWDPRKLPIRSRATARGAIS